MHTETKKEEEKEINSKDDKKFVKPSVDELKKYCLERKNTINAQQFFDYYESKGWLIGKNPMKDWKAAIRTWEQNQIKYKNNRNGSEEIESFDYENTPYRAF